MNFTRFLTAMTVWVGIGLLMPAKLPAQAPTIVYGDLLANGFQNWSWGDAPNLTNTYPVHGGSDSIGAAFAAWDAISFYHAPFDASAYSSLSFWANGGTNGGQQISFFADYGYNGATGPRLRVPIPDLPANTWTQVVVKLEDLGVAAATNLNRFTWQLTDGGATGEFYLDDVQLNVKPAPALVHLTANRDQGLRTADFRWAAVTTGVWDGDFDTEPALVIGLLEEMGAKLLRYPGGGQNDVYHWAANTIDPTLDETSIWWGTNTSFASFVHVATNVGAQAIIEVNYGTGSSNEAAAWVAYANAGTTNTLSLGVDLAGVNWQTAGYWASLRAAAPLAQDDGKNFLRLSRSAPFGYAYWEVGNENYLTGEPDTNSPSHDPYNYAIRTAGYIALMKAVDPTIKIGVPSVPGEDGYANNTNHPVVNPATGLTHYGWTPVMLATFKSLGVMPDFLIYHYYPENTDPNNPAGSDSDPLLLLCSNWAGDAGDLRQQLSDYAGSSGAGIELLCTENNADAGVSGLQSTSLVDGLYYADSLGQLMQTEFNSRVWYGFRIGSDTRGCFDSWLYGWRTYGDMGMVSDGEASGMVPVPNPTKFPTFYAAKLMQYFAQAGDTILASSSDYPWLAIYAAQKTSGALSLLVLNKDMTNNFNGQITLNDYNPAASAMVRSFGLPQDAAAQTNGPAAAQDIATNIFTGVSTTFNYNFPPLSMTLFTLSPSAPTLAVVPSAQPGERFVLRLQGQPGARYYLQTTTNFPNWENLSTNRLTTSWEDVTNPIPAGTTMKFFRAVWQP